MTPALAQVRPTPVLTPTDDAEALMRQRQEAQEALAPLQAVNPFAPSGIGAPSGLAMPTGPMSQALQVLQSPPMQAYMRVLSQPKVQETAQRLVTNPNRLNLLYSEIAWVLLFLIFRAWRRGKARNLAGRLWVGLYTFVLSLLIGGVVIPYAWLGDDFLTLVTAVLEGAQEAVSTWVQSR